VDGNLLLQLLDSAGFACSSGSACKTACVEAFGIPSRLRASRALAISISERITEFDDVVGRRRRRIRHA